MSLSIQSTEGAPAYVLLVEDDHGLAELVCDTLLDLGLAVRHADNGAAALNILAGQRPALLLVDYSLTDMKAPDFLDEADKLPGGVPPFIVITGAGDERIAVSLMKRGARDYLVKDRNFLDELPMALGRVLRETETQHRLVEAEQQLRDMLEEKEALLREVHHRVKNNLQAIIHLIGLQADSTQDTTVKMFLAELQEQARTMAVVYQQLYQSENLAQVEMDLYLRSLADNLLHAFGRNRNVRSDVAADAVKMDVETATPCGMITNELITNSLKYAFEGLNEGHISVTLAPENSGWELVISDDGTGLPPSFDLNNQTSLGLRLVKLWVTHQLGGTLEIIGAGKGTTFRIRFSPRQKGRMHSQASRTDVSG